jgi:hypothetical protein
MHDIKVEWTGRYPNLCSGIWKISIDGNQMTLPDFIRDQAMETEKSYATWSFGSDWNEIWEYYEDGLPFEEWIKKNVGWIKPALDKMKITDFTYKDLYTLYNLINEKDWRSNSCGGCI